MESTLNNLLFVRVNSIRGDKEAINDIYYIADYYNYKFGKDSKNKDKILNILDEIVRNYIQIKPVYHDESYHGSAHMVFTGSYDVVGNIPAAIIDKITEIATKVRKEYNIRKNNDKTGKKIYDELNNLDI